jgi:SAM-dependent methyltransferase
MTLLLAIIGTLVLMFGFVVAFGAPYVPSKRREVRDAFEKLYPLGPGDVVVDIGSGDGVVLRVAAKFGAHAVGYEINPILVLISRIVSARYEGIEVRLADLFRSTFPDDTTVVYMFSESRDIKRMFKKVEREATRLGRPLSVISYGFQNTQYELKGELGAHFMYVVGPAAKS